ncbi:MAG: glycoside hydrolase family 32 protein [Clostridiaceae bacterium]
MELMEKGEIIELVQEAEKHLMEVEQDKYRLHYHLMPPVGLSGDPNGMCQFNGVYHIFYIYAPRAYFKEKRSQILWGHYTTKDFLTYKREDNALYPDTPWDKDGVYSGCAFIEDDTMNLFYTGNVRYEGSYDYISDGREQNLIYTVSKDGIHFNEKKLLMRNEDYPSNMSKHVRDPLIWKEDNNYYMILGARDNNSQGCILLYESTDLFKWKFINTVTTEEKFGYMWECPDIFELDGKRIIITCPQGIEQQGIKYQNSHQCGYFEILKDLKSQYKLTEFKQLDYGFDFYAARTFQDDRGRRILYGWMGVPESPYLVNKTVKNGWQQALSIPRELIYGNGALYQKPIEELKNLRKDKKDILMSEIEKEIYHSVCFELNIKFNKDEDFKVLLREDCKIEYCIDNHILKLSMGVCGDGRSSRSVQLKFLSDITIFSDTSSLEIFINDSETVMTTRIFGDSDEIVLYNQNATATLYELDKHKIIW